MTEITALPPAPAPAWRARALGRLAAMALQALGATWRLRTEHMDVMDAMLARRDPVIIVSWHEHYLMLLSILRGRHACVFTSASPQGDMIAKICTMYDMIPVQIPDRGGEVSYGIMKGALAEHPAAAMAVDGPLGPFHQVKSGAIKLASELGFTLQPVGAAAGWSMVASHRWDRLITPLPFSRCSAVFEEPMRVSAGVSETAISDWETALRNRLEAATKRAKTLLRERRSES